ncbi:S9 family peptidase [Microbacteriaceae bacterium VKM Ac-2855]|nr:S9 family peptidase [Microbacteriaceae bacterium VKM Ac-2855]
MRIPDLDDLITLSRPSVAPDGRTAVVAASRPDLAGDRYTGQLWLFAVDGATPGRRLTRGIRDSAPAYAPNGRVIAFLREDGSGRAQVHIVDARGGEPLRITDAPLGVSELAWAPDSARLAVIARVPEGGRYGTDPAVGADAEPPRRIDRLRWSSNGVGYVLDRPAHLHVLRVPDLAAEPPVPPIDPSSAHPVGPELRRLSSGRFDHSSPQFSPDGSLISVIAARHAGRDDDRRTGLYGFVSDGSVREPILLSGAGPDLGISASCWLPDGRIAVVAVHLGPSGRDFVGRDCAVHRFELDGSVRRLTGAGFDAAEGAPLGEVDGRILAHRRSRGRVSLVAVDDDGIESLIDGDVEVLGHGVGGGCVVATAADASSPGELMTVGGARLSAFAAPLADELVRPVEITAEGRDGYPLHGWVAVPDGNGPHPTLLMIHGGPFSQYSVSLLDEVQILVSAGYAVVFGNPRGSAGYGEAHARAIRGALGTVDADDALDLLDAALAHDPRLDAARVGILGGSYGGYLTAWIIAHEHRFAAAIVERGYLDPEAFVGTSDIGMFFSDEYVGVTPSDYARQSPQAVVASVRTPTLVIHSERDLRCPLGQAERYFTALRRNGVDAEMLIFPGENHELSRSGRPRHRAQRFEAILEWWERHLPVRGRAEAATSPLAP